MHGRNATKKKILIVGGTGYLGRHVIQKLSESGYEVTCTFLEDEDYVNIKVIDEEIRFVRCDMKEIEKLLKSKEYQWILNLAALYERANIRLSSIVNVNSILGIQLLSLACEYHVKNFLTIDTSLPDGFNLYSFTKKRVADFGRFLSEQKNFNFINIKLEMFFGDGDPIDRFIPMCIHKLKSNGVLRLTEGTQVRDIIRIEDVVGIIMRIIEKELIGSYDIPVGTGEGVSIREMVTYMKEYIGSSSIIEFGAVKSRINEPDCIADTDKLFGLIGRYGFIYNWKSGLEASIKETSI